jgi:hypothetical protein
MTLFNIFLGTFLIGVTLMVLPTLLGVVGLGDDYDAEGGSDGDADGVGDAEHDHGESRDAGIPRPAGSHGRGTPDHRRRGRSLGSRLISH